MDSSKRAGTPGAGGLKSLDPYLSESDRQTMFSDLFSKIMGKNETKTPSQKNTSASNDEESGGLVSSYANKMKDGFFNSLTKTRSVLNQSQERVTTSMNFAKNLPYIILLLVAGGFFLMISLFYLPTVLIWPSKFSFSFAIASICFLSAIALVRDPTTFMKALLQPDKIKYSLAYALSLIGTFYFSMISKSSLFSLIFAFAQIISLAWLIGSSIPGGLTVVGSIQNFCLSMCKNCFGRMVGNRRENSFLPI
mmetsp:Transcript_21381/g.24846  ORF Transcript_21381/g.24846 Transcript_21381/m.24846 type:complete len:251 (+) Transcript_21381:28-780(+)